MNPHTPRELPPWELESWCTIECLESDCKGQNSMDWKVLYTIGKLLKRRCLKWACTTHLDIWNTSYGRKRGRKSNWQFDFWPLKVENRPNFLTWKWRVTYRWKALDKGYKFTLDLIPIEGLQAKLWSPKIAGIPTLAISRFPFGNLETKCHLNVSLLERHRVYYKGEGRGFPQIWAVVSLVTPVSPNCPWFVLTLKVLQLCTNHLVLVLCKSMWVIDVCHSS